MPHFYSVCLCALSALVISSAVGLPLAKWIARDWIVTVVIAPATGWAVFSALELTTLSLAGFTRITAGVSSGVAVLVGVMAIIRLWKREPATRSDNASAFLWSIFGAALLAVVPASGVWPKQAGDGIFLAAPVFDHSKVAIIDDFIRLGLPPGNPFFGPVGTSPGLAYYYLWHFSAATFGMLSAATGWEADIGLTWFTAFASLALLIGLSVWLSGRTCTAPFVIAVSLAASLRPILSFVFTPAFLARAFSQAEPPHSWLYQASWVPQHLASASCVLLAAVILFRLAGQGDWRGIPLLAVVVAAGFESSVWVGGIVFAASAATFGAFVVLTADGTRDRAAFLAKAATAAILALAISFPFLRDEYAATAARYVGMPIALRPFEVLGAMVTPVGLRHVLDLPAFWLALMAIEFPAIYVAGATMMATALARRGMLGIERRLVVGLALFCSVSLCTSWLLVSTIANNDLGWRGVLPGILILTVFAAAGLTHWLATSRATAMAAITCVALGLPGGLQIIRDNATGLTAPSASILAQSPALWAAVRRYAAPDERVGNNPLFLADSVSWPVNISWALFADRRSCYAGWELARAYVALPKSALLHLEQVFEQVFAGEGTPQEIQDLATRYDCRVVVVSASDGAWKRDPFAVSPFYRLVDQQEGEWRIYSAVDRSAEP